MKTLYTIVFLLAMAGCKDSVESSAFPEKSTVPFVWDNATIYFLLTDRFYNGKKANDLNFDRKPDGAVLRNFEGGDIAGITLKIREGYFSDLGVNALWFTPPVEQVHGHTDEGTGKTYGYHGYWTRDWTSIDPNFGTWDELKTLVDEAHQRGIRIIMDVVINHTGPVTTTDSQWPTEWVRTDPVCQFKDFESTVTCTLVKNLPDIKTESDEAVDLPVFLIEKWKKEGRYDQEVAELDAFFAATGFPRSPRHYIMKWQIDFIKKLGVDGYRVDTAKHTEPEVWAELQRLAAAAFEQWKKDHPEDVLDNNPFYMMGEVYNYSIQHGLDFDMGGGDTINFFDYGFNSLINFDLKASAGRSLEDVFSSYSAKLHGGALSGFGTVNYLSSHDDGAPYDPKRENAIEAATRLLLTPGTAQIYYGDELARPLQVEGANGDAHLRSFMNWGDLVRRDHQARTILVHWQKIGTFRQHHPSVGAGVHQKVNDQPYMFTRTWSSQDDDDRTLVVIGSSEGEFGVKDIFADGARVRNYYTDQLADVSKGRVNFDPGTLFLIGEVD